MAFEKGQGGRPKGAKNKVQRTSEPSKKAMRAIGQVAVAAKSAAGLALPAVAPTVAPEGISPKDLLLATMRSAWESAHAKAREAAEIEAGIGQVEDADVVKRMGERVAELRVEAGRHVAIAQQAAKDVAPYEHARLQSVDANVTGGLVVEIKQYTIPTVKEVR